MIYDKLENLDFYRYLSKNIYEGLVFLRDVKPELLTGDYLINSKIRALVSEYETKTQNTCGFEAHREYLDIQYLLMGEEKILYSPLEFLNGAKEYNKDTDAAFFEKANTKPLELIIGHGYFSIFSPNDGHMPQLCIDTPMKVKKIVMKIKLK